MQRNQAEMPPRSTNPVAVTAGAIVVGAFLTIVFIRGSFRRFTF